jgi:two-component sensor histidine kinase
MRIFIKYTLSVLFLTFSLLALSIDEKNTETELLPHASIYIDYDNNETIDTIMTKTFSPVTKNVIGFGYAPKYTVWVKFNLQNTSDQPIKKIIEYANPLTSHVVLYDAKTKHMLLNDGLANFSKKRLSTNPVAPITLQPHTTETLYLKAYSKTTPLIVRLKLWNEHHFFEKEFRHQFILALFFGAMFFIIIYNFIVYLSTKDRSYLYYVLFFVGITIHQLFYRGVAPLYFIPPELADEILRFSVFIVAFPALFLGLFIRKILSLKRYRTINIIFSTYLFAFPILTLLCFVLGLHNYRNLPTMFLLAFILVILLYAIKKKNNYAYVIAFGWFLFIAAAVAMQLSSMGKVEVFTDALPYFSEMSLLLEAILFALVLSDKIKRLHQENIRNKELLIRQQEQEEIRLKEKVRIKTAELEEMLGEKQLLLQELNHRVKNNLQTILFFINSKERQTENEETLTMLKGLRDKVYAISHLHNLLYEPDNAKPVKSEPLFTSIANLLRQSYAREDIDISIETYNISLQPKEAFYSGFILSELLSNSFKYAFNKEKKGEIIIRLSERGGQYVLDYRDTGIGFDSEGDVKTSGVDIIKRLVESQLKGSFNIYSEKGKGTRIVIKWKRK